MNKILLIVLAFFFLASCDKVKRTQKKLEGNWKLVEYKYTTPTKLAYYYDATGTMSFSNNQGSNCDFAIDVDYTIDGTSYPLEASGYMEFSDFEYYTMYREELNGSHTEFKDGRILTITKDDLIIIFKNELGQHSFVMEK